MGILGAAGEGTAEGAKKGLKWWLVGFGLTALALGGVAALAGLAIGVGVAAIFGAPLIGVGLAVAAVAGILGTLIGGGMVAGSGAGVAVAGAGAVMGVTKGVNNHIKRGQNKLDQQKAELIAEQQQLIQTMRVQDEGIINPAAPQDGRYGARVAAERQAMQQQRQGVPPLS